MKYYSLVKSITFTSKFNGHFASRVMDFQKSYIFIFDSNQWFVSHMFLSAWLKFQDGPSVAILLSSFYMHKTLPSQLKLVGIGIGIDLETLPVQDQLLVSVLNG